MRLLRAESSPGLRCSGAALAAPRLRGHARSAALEGIDFPSFQTAVELSRDQRVQAVLGFKQDWAYRDEGEVIVAQVSRGDFELILNKDEIRAGNGRIYFHLDDRQIEALSREVQSKGVATKNR